MDAEFMAKLFHDTYEKLAPEFNYETRKASAKPWFDVPENNRKLMIAVAEKILSVQKRQTEDNCLTIDCYKNFEDATNKLYQVLIKPKGLRQRLLQWLYPELVDVANTLRECYWKGKKNEGC